MSENYNDYHAESIKCRKLEQIYMSKNRQRLEARGNYELPIEELRNAIRESNLAKKDWELQEKIVKFVLHNNKKYKG